MHVAQTCFVYFNLFLTSRVVKTGNPTRPGSIHHGLVI